MRLIEKRQYIKDDGEIIRESSNSFADALNEEGYRFPSHKLGARMFRDVQLPEMSYAEKGRMSELARYYMIPGANMLGYRQGNHIIAYTFREIGELVGLTARSKCSAFINRMLQLHVMHRIHDTSGKPQFYINPAYYMANGQRLSLNLYLLFKDELTPLLPAWVMAEFLAQARGKAMFASDALTEAESIVRGDD